MAKFLTKQSSLFSDAQTGRFHCRSVAESAAYRERAGKAIASAYQAAIEQGDHLAGLPNLQNSSETASFVRWIPFVVQAVLKGEEAAPLLSELQRQAEACASCLETK